MLHISYLSILRLTLENFSLYQGELVCVMGPSGSGKSLLLRAIADLDPNDGVVTLGGIERVKIDAPEWRKNVTYVATTPAWWGDYVRDHFSDERRAREELAMMALPADVFDWTIDRLSTGESQRVSLARAIAGTPKFLLLDEPTSSLDEAAAFEVERRIAQLAADTTGIIMVTHDLAQARRMGSRLLVFSEHGVTEQRL